jgi:pimeloyl-ACP methyl ester carboxylesterase
MNSAKAAPAPRGEFVDLDGRRMHVVRAGPPPGTERAEPLVLLEAGSFGFSADWAEVQAQLAALGVRSMTYDRAGLGLSDPGPAPRDGLSIVGDCERLLAAVGETGPLILVGHSMAGLHLHLFAGRNPAKVAGIVLVDAVTPTVASDVAVRHGAAQYRNLARLVAWPRLNPVLRALSPWGDMIGLAPDAAAHKRWAFHDLGQRRAAADEILQWETTVAQAAAAGPLDPNWPVVVVAAGPAPMYLKPRAIQADPAWKARRGYVENVRKASHASLVGRRHAGVVVKAIDFVRKAAP